LRDGRGHGVAGARDVDVDGTADPPPPAPPHELDSDSVAERLFDAEGAPWFARLAGKSAGGTGPYGLAMVQAIHFFRAERPDLAVREALAARGRFDGMFDEELIAMLARATPIRMAQGEPSGDGR
jgi:hypothetical protein